MNSPFNTAMRPAQPSPLRTGACAVVLATCLMTTAWASTPKVWRCDLGGQITYADQPCDKLLAPAQAAKALQSSVDAADPRTLEQRRTAQAVARADQDLARQMQQERRAREQRALRPAGAAIIGLPPDALAQPAIRKPSMEARSTRQQRPQATDPSTAHTSPSTAPVSRRGPG
jgi:hypothetical protein